MKYIFLLLILSIAFLGCSTEAQPQINQDSANNQNVQKTELQCPKGLNHEPYPGSCPLYVDDNNDGQCDYG